MFTFPGPSSPLSIDAPTFVPTFNAVRAASGGGGVPGLPLPQPGDSFAPVLGADLDPSMYRTFLNSSAPAVPATAPGRTVVAASAGGPVKPGASRHPADQNNTTQPSKKGAAGDARGGGGARPANKRGKGKRRDAKISCGICGGEYDGANPVQEVMHIGGRPHRIALAESCGGASACAHGCACG